MGNVQPPLCPSPCPEVPLQQHFKEDLHLPKLLCVVLVHTFIVLIRAANDVLFGTQWLLELLLASKTI